ncbi:hypothetical protein CPB86DRAFT_191300 [Serendipita vermifera]|nr:hypothetical protein CPB86DRAFT_191300 [Serendipita vermifera]
MASPQYPGPAPPGHFPVEPPVVETYGSWYPPQPQTHIVPQTSAPSRPVQPVQYPVDVALVPVNSPSAVAVTAPEVDKAPSVSSSSKRSKQSKMEVDELPSPDKPEKVHGKKRVATDVDTTEYMELDQDNSEEQARSTKRSKKESQATEKEPEVTQVTTSKAPVRNPAVEQIARAAKRTRAQAASETDTYEPEVARKRLKTETTTELEPPLTATPSNSRKSQALLANETTPPTVDDVATTQDQEAATPKTWLEADGCTSTDPLCKSRKVGKMWMNRKWGFRVGMDGLRERLCEITVRRKPSRAIRLVSQSLFLFKFHVRHV